MPFQIVPTLPEEFCGNSRAAEIAVSPDGRMLHASNRGHESIASFAIAPGDGRLSAPGWVACGGRTPRFFSLDPAGERLFVANEATDSIQAFRIRDGRPEPAGAVVQTGSPVCILFRRVG